MTAARKPAAILALAIALFLGTAVAHAELTASGDLFVSFSGGIAPNDLPRDRLAPISVSLTGKVRTLSGERPPALRRIKIALSSSGRLEARGLPTCRLNQIETSSSKQALAACGPALVGSGDYAARTAFPDQSAFPADGKILAFNAIVDGGRAIVAHIYGSDPAPTTRLVVFRIRHLRGTYGTLLVANLPALVNRYGYVERLTLDLHRVYTAGGRTRTYLGAACAAPAGFTAATFPFARATMIFSDHRRLSSVLTRTCRVRANR